MIDELPPGRTPVKTVVLAETRRDEVVQRIRTACLGGTAGLLGLPADRRIGGNALSGGGGNGRGAGRGAAGAHGRAGARPHAGRRPRSAPCAASRTGKSSCWWQPPSSRSASMCRTPRSWSSRTPSAWDWRSCISCAAASAAGSTRVPACCCTARRCRRWRASGSAVMRDTNDGFEVARRDLELRGPGELLGTRQTGLAQMRVADLLRDADLLPRVQIAAEPCCAIGRARGAAHPPLGGTCRAIRPRRVESLA